MGDSFENIAEAVLFLNAIAKRMKRFGALPLNTLSTLRLKREQ
jgi:hypothetical protein